MNAEKLKNEKAVDVLNELVIINNDRYEGYLKATEETNEPDLKQLFTQYSNQSLRLGQELRDHVRQHDGIPDEGTKNTGKIYRAWMDIRAAIASNDRKAVLSSCEFGEDVALQAYKDALKDESELPSASSTLIRQQFSELKQAHDHVKRLRDTEK
jgi:uncharacterized protein (TIGR02284 family)